MDMCGGFGCTGTYISHYITNAFFIQCLATTSEAPSPVQSPAESPSSDDAAAASAATDLPNDAEGSQNKMFFWKLSSCAVVHGCVVVLVVPVPITSHY